MRACDVPTVSLPVLLLLCLFSVVECISLCGRCATACYRTPSLPSRARVCLCRQVATFYFTYILLLGLGGLIMNILRIGPLVVTYIMLKWVARTPRAIHNVYLSSSGAFPWGSQVRLAPHVFCLFVCCVASQRTLHQRRRQQCTTKVSVSSKFVLYCFTVHYSDSVSSELPSPHCPALHKSHICVCFLLLHTLNQLRLQQCTSPTV